MIVAGPLRRGSNSGAQAASEAPTEAIAAAKQAPDHDYTNTMNQESRDTADSQLVEGAFSLCASVDRLAFYDSSSHLENSDGQL